MALKRSLLIKDQWKMHIINMYSERVPASIQIFPYFVYSECQGGWLEDLELRFYVPFYSISVVSGRRAGNNERRFQWNNV